MRRALVTGGSGALGAAICRQLAKDGFEVCVHGNVHADAAQRVADGIVAAGGRARAVTFDVVNPEQTGAALEALLADGPIQVLVNNAGVNDDAIMAGMRREQWTRVIDVALHKFLTPAGERRDWRCARPMCSACST